MAVEHLQRAVGNQEAKEDSTLAFYRAMIGFRRGYPALAKGSFTLVQAQGGILSFIREHEGLRVFCAFNLTNAAFARRPAAGRLAAGSGRALHGNAARDRGHAAAIPGLFRRAGGGLTGSAHRTIKGEETGTWPISS